MHLLSYWLFQRFFVSHTRETLQNDDERAVALQAPSPCFCLFVCLFGWLVGWLVGWLLGVVVVVVVVVSFL